MQKESQASTERKCRREEQNEWFAYLVSGHEWSEPWRENADGQSKGKIVTKTTQTLPVLG